MKTMVSVFCVLVFFLSCTSRLAIEKEVERPGGVVLVVKSPSVLDNKVGYAGSKMLSVYLPKDYTGSSKKYPVIYYLHGFGGSSVEVFSYRRLFDEWFDEHPDKRCIIVGVDGDNAFGGSFYANGPLSGRWEDFVTIEVVSCIDGKFRTLATPESRAITGFSMGGFGAVNIALRHPDTYSVLYAVGPGLFDESGLADAMKSWEGDKGFLDAYGSVFGYDPSLPAPHYRLPAFDGTAEDDKAIRAWESGFGNLKQKIADYLAKKERLVEIDLAYGILDSYAWIPRGTDYFAKLLGESNIPYRLFVHAGGHSFFSPDVVQGDLLPNVTSRLKY